MPENNTIILNGCIKEFQEKNSLERMSSSEIFEMFAVFQLTKEVDLTHTEVEHSIVDEGQDGGIDSFIILHNNFYVRTLNELKDIHILENSKIKIFISQIKTEKTFKEDVFDKLNSSLPLMLDFTKSSKALLQRFNTNLVEKITIMKEICQKAVISNCKIEFFYSYACKANDIRKNTKIDSKREQIITLTKTHLPHAEVVFELHSARELLALYRRKKMLTFELKLKEQAVPVQFADNKYGYIGVSNLNDYYNLIVDSEGNIREYALEDNIRYFQGDVEVNKRILETLKTDNTRDFWWLNNGITIIASQCRTLPRKLVMDNPKIVNGVQTTFMIERYFREQNPNDDRSILVKVIASEDDETIDKIISATNSQTPVSPALLRATDNIQRNLELFFQNNGFFYDRRKNFYRNKGKPIRRIFGIQFTAQAIESILNFDPASARSKPTTLIKEDRSYKRIFNQERDFKAYLNCCLITQRVYDYIRTLGKNTKGYWKNFAFHIARILTSAVLEKHKYGPQEVADLNIDLITMEEMKNANRILRKILKGYKKQHPRQNPINIAKSKKFSIEIDNFLAKSISTTS